MFLFQTIYWKMGVEDREAISLSDIEIEEIQELLSGLYNDSESYINAMYKREYVNAINTVTAKDIVNDVMSVRSHCLLHGVEVLEVVHHLINNPVTTSFVPKTIIYSNVFGRATGKSKTQALLADGKMKPPFKPTWNGLNYNKIDSLQCYIVRIGGAPRVGGITVNYTNGESYTSGNTSSEFSTLVLNGRFITTVETWGFQAVDKISFSLSDGDVFSYGKAGSYNYRKFGIEKHEVVGIFIASDEPSLAKQAASLMVSYYLLTTEDSASGVE